MDELTIEEVAAEAGIPVSTVRMYQNRGLIAAPERRGRVGYYGDDHRSKLRLIAHLQERGFSLAAIKDALDSWNAGRSIDDLLGVGEIAPSLVRKPLRLTPAEFGERFAGVDITPPDMARAIEIGLVTLDGSDLVIANEMFADVGPQVAKLGVPVSEILDEYEALQAAVAEIATRFRAVFERHVWQPFAERGMPADEIDSLTTDVAQLTSLATSTVSTELQDRFAAFVDEYVELALKEGS